MGSTFGEIQAWIQDFAINFWRNLEFKLEFLQKLTFVPSHVTGPPLRRHWADEAYFNPRWTARSIFHSGCGTGGGGCLPEVSRACGVLLGSDSRSSRPRDQTHPFRRHWADVAYFNPGLYRFEMLPTIFGYSRIDFWEMVQMSTFEAIMYGRWHWADQAYFDPGLYLDACCRGRRHWNPIFPVKYPILPVKSPD